MAQTKDATEKRYQLSDAINDALRRVSGKRAYLYFHDRLSTGEMTILAGMLEQLAERFDRHDERVTELLAANNLEVERRRAANAMLASIVVTAKGPRLIPERRQLIQEMIEADHALGDGRMAVTLEILLAIHDGRPLASDPAEEGR